MSIRTLSILGLALAAGSAFAFPTLRAFEPADGRNAMMPRYGGRAPTSAEIVIGGGGDPGVSGASGSCRMEFTGATEFADLGGQIRLGDSVVAGYSRSAIDDDDSTSPSLPAPKPEPTAMGVVSIGIVAMLRRRRSRAGSPLFGIAG